MASADLQRLAFGRDVTSEPDENLPVSGFLQGIDMCDSNQRVAMNANEEILVLGLELLQGVVDQVFPVAVCNPSVFLVRLKERDALDWQQS